MNIDEIQRKADIDDVALNIYLYKHQEWLECNPEYTQSPYSALIAEMCGQMDLFEKNWNKE